MKEVVLPHWLTPCFIESCSSLRIGLVASGLCLCFASIVIHVVQRTKSNRGKLSDDQSGEGEGNQFVIHLGCCLYLIAGGALIGTLPFKPVVLKEDVATVFLWLAGFFVVISSELLMLRYRRFDESVSYSRLIAVPASLAIIAWIGSGAKWVQ